MRKCPNCAQATAKTKDWACPWCGYPLLSEKYGEIPKTYKQLQEEKRRKQQSPLREHTGASNLPTNSTLASTHTPESERERKLIPESERALIVTPVEVTVEELYSLIAMQSFKVTGLVDKIVLNDIYDVYYVILTSAENTLELNVQCTFDKKHIPELNQLTKGQTVTVQGKYAGYIINMLMRDCILVH
jgi:uncharacterized Zn finger protein (UPF0148 family)